MKDGKKKRPLSSLPCRRAEIILKVRSGFLTAVEAAKILGVSRKTYYKWEKRGLSGLVNALDAGKNGRPEQSEENLETQKLQEEITRLREENDLLERKMNLKDIAHQLELDILDNTDNKKKE
jgi:transposase